MKYFDSKIACFLYFYEIFFKNTVKLLLRNTLMTLCIKSETDIVAVS